MKLLSDRIDEKALAATELFKRNNLEIFLEKYKRRQPFELQEGGQIVLKVTKENLARIADGNLTGIRFEGADGQIYGLKDLAKTAEFGSKYSHVENAALQKAQAGIEQIQASTEKQLIPVWIGKGFVSVAGIENTPGTPKSDFHLINGKGDPVIWISHKDGKKASDFSQWSGMTEPAIFAHKEVQKFITDLKREYPEGLPPTTAVGRKIKDKRLKMLAVYGADFGGKLGINNVSVVVQGSNPALVKKGRGYVIDAVHVHYNGEEMTGPYEPILLAVYKGDRSQFGLAGTRFSIYPLGGRKINRMI